MNHGKRSALKQYYYIIKYTISDRLRFLILRFRLWIKPKKNCRYCCLWCKYFDICLSELLESEESE